jgi:hypothetical protein
MTENRGRPSRAEDVEEIDFLLSCHQGVGAIMTALGITNSQSLARNMERYGRPDLARIFRTQSTIFIDHPDERVAIR